MPRTVWIMAGESSGDAYGALLARALHEASPDLVIRGMGGADMARAGVDLLVDSSELGVVGFVEIVRHLRTFWRIFHDLIDRAVEEHPQAVVLIDYPGFNLRFGARLREHGIKVIYYVSPQVWAWGKRRIPKIARIVDHMLVIFPFERDVYAGTGLDVEFVGHPLLEALAGHLESPPPREPNTVLLLPGSRRAEVDRLLPVMLAVAERLCHEREELRFVIAVPREAIATHVQTLMKRHLPTTDRLSIRIETGKTRQWLQRASAGIAASGTVTVEAAILGLPLVVAYRLNWLTFLGARLLVRLPYFTMVNLVADDTVFEEFLQAEVTPPNLQAALKAILPGGTRREAVLAGMSRMSNAWGGGESSQRQGCRRSAERDRPEHRCNHRRQRNGTTVIDSTAVPFGVVLRSKSPKASLTNCVYASACALHSASRSDADCAVPSSCLLCPFSF